jgi:hypothetical protein
MTAKTISLRSDLVDRLENLAQTQGRTLDEVFSDLLDHYSPDRQNWALALAEGMEAADIEWQDDPSAAERSREYYEQYLADQWQRTQHTDTGQDD